MCITSTIRITPREGNRIATHTDLRRASIVSIALSVLFLALFYLMQSPIAVLNSFFFLMVGMIFTVLPETKKEPEVV